MKYFCGGPCGPRGGRVVIPSTARHHLSGRDLTEFDSELPERLALAELQVSDGERQVARLRSMIAEIGRQGDDAQPVINMLHHFERALASHIADRDRLPNELRL